MNINGQILHCYRVDEMNFRAIAFKLVVNCKTARLHYFADFSKIG